MVMLSFFNFSWKLIIIILLFFSTYMYKQLNFALILHCICTCINIIPQLHMYNVQCTIECIQNKTNNENYTSTMKLFLSTTTVVPLKMECMYIYMFYCMCAARKEYLLSQLTSDLTLILAEVSPSFFVLTSVMKEQLF